MNDLFEAIKIRRRRQSLTLYPEVSKILSDIEVDGDRAIERYTQKFDGLVMKPVKVPMERIKKAFEDAEDSYKHALQTAINNIREFHMLQALQDFELKRDGLHMGQLIRPVDRVGIYVPGGDAAYPSTLLMNVIPAQIAGVSEIAVFTPPQNEESKLLTIFAAAYAVGLSEIYLIGGVQAIGAMAYGTESIKAVDKITGPGNQYVTAAKKLVYGEVGIDMIAGPSEVMIVSDGNQSPDFIAADLLAQMEHDGEAMALVVTLSAKEADAIEKELIKQLESLEQCENARKAFEMNTFICVCDDMASALTLVNQVAPEHLEILTLHPETYLKDVKHAGSIFLGAYTPEALGDYIAGPNHTLPTTGSARFTSALGTYDFQKRMNYLQYTAEALTEVASDVMIFARKEGLEAHGKAIEKRLDVLKRQRI